MSRQELLNAVLEGAPGGEIARLPVPDRYLAALVRREDQDMFGSAPPSERDPLASIRVEEVSVPELAPDEAFIAVMASAINHNTVWSSIFLPLPTFGFLERMGKGDVRGRRHDLPYHVLGSDAAGVVVRVGSMVNRWQPGDRVIVHCAYTGQADPASHNDAMLSAELRAWGYETNFGGLGEFAVVKGSQLLPKPGHLTWEEAAVNGVCNSTAYRMLASPHGARVSQGDVVLIWGTGGGLGSYAAQYVRNGGGVPVCVTSSAARAELLSRLGYAAVIDRTAAGYRFWRDPHTQDPEEWRRLGRDIRALVGEDPHIVVEHPGRDTMGASVFVARRGGVVVTCAATTGYMVEYDQRHLWMKVKTIKATHAANYWEADRANDLVRRGMIQPTLTSVCRLDTTGAAAREVHHNRHVGKIGVLCLAPDEGLGIEDPAARSAIGEDRITAFRRHAEALGLVPDSSPVRSGVGANTNGADGHDRRSKTASNHEIWSALHTDQTP